MTMSLSSLDLDGVLRVASEARAETPSARKVDLAHLRSPHEIPAVVACVGANLGLVAIALALIWSGAEWLEAHPVVAERRTELLAIVIVAALAPLAEIVGRHMRVFGARGNGVLVSATQAPELYAILLRECATLGIKEVPDLYVSREVEGMAEAYSVFGRRSCVVISADYLIDGDWKSKLDALAFAIGHGLGSLRLGHTRWWLELLTVYAIRIPFLRTPMLEAYTFSRDRCAAFAVPGGIRGLLLTGAGKEMFPDLDVPSFIEQARTFVGFWPWFSGLPRKTPHLCQRVRVLYETGFFDRRRDLARFAS